MKTRTKWITGTVAAAIVAGALLRQDPAPPPELIQTEATDLLGGLTQMSSYLIEYNPVNKDSLHYLNHFNTAAMTSEQGALMFALTRLDSIHISLRPPDTLVVNFPDRVMIFPGVTLPPWFLEDLPYAWPTQAPMGVALMFNQTPEVFRSVFRFGQSYEVWGTEPGNGPAPAAFEEASVALNHELLSGWVVSKEEALSDHPDSIGWPGARYRLLSQGGALIYDVRR